jgi:hypothetical protein
LALNDTKEIYTASAALLSQMDTYYSAIMTPVVIASPAAK